MPTSHAHLLLQIQHQKKQLLLQHGLHEQVVNHLNLNNPLYNLKWLTKLPIVCTSGFSVVYFWPDYNFTKQNTQPTA